VAITISMKIRLRIRMQFSSISLDCMVKHGAPMALARA
jgi:hypothetical protein